jgi:hypothetical protein
MVKIVKLQQLRAQLQALLVDRPNLAADFAEALGEQDEQALARAFEGLRNAPNDLRLAVEAVILDWLFGGVPIGEGKTAAADPFADHAEVSSLIH